MQRAAIILAGGRGSRLGGVDKASVRLGGERLIDRVLAAEVAALERIVVGEVTEVPTARVIAESPRFGGPALAVAAGLGALGTDAELVDVLSCDFVHPELVVAALDNAGTDFNGDGLVLVAEGRMQWLASRIRVAPLRAALAEVQPGDSLRQVFAALRLQEVSVPAEVTADFDTLADIEAAGAQLPAPHREGMNRDA
ncbi:molybdenum cofactor guanylyltransferase [Gulosibacter macacae]|nr:NTP transferase domain-containing protein [Gulosibacter macacae]